jgi:hypothetical protein
MKYAHCKWFTLMFLSFVFPVSGMAQSQGTQNYNCSYSFGNQISVPVTAIIPCGNGSTGAGGASLLSSSSTSSAFAFSGPNPVGSNQAISIHVTLNAAPGSYSGTIYASYKVPTYSTFYYIFNYTVNVTATVEDSGFVNPKYVVVSVEYAPPGTSSSATYGNNTVVGSSVSEKDSFSTQATHSVSLSLGVGIPGFTRTKTQTNSSSYTQEQDTSYSLAVSQTSSLETGVNGVETPAGTNHDYDIIRVWFNPIFTYAVVDNSSQVTWTGLGYDLNDTDAYPYMELVDVKMGCLNGDIPSTDTNCSYFFGRAARTWALSNVDGSGPELTGNGAACVPGSESDICHILAADPFSDPNYTFTFPSGGYTTTDGRFTACHDNPNCTQTISCVPGTFTNYSQGYSVTATQDQTAVYKYTQTFAVEDQFKGTNFMTTLGADLQNQTTLSWTHQFTQSTNNSQGQTASFAIQPSSNYPGPQGFDVYQDNLFGTFVFRPIP